MKKTIKYKEILINNGEDNKKLYINLNGKGYDVTDYIKSHPGGKIVLAEKNYDDKYKIFMSFHSIHAKRLVKQCYIGDINDYPYDILDHDEILSINDNEHLIFILKCLLVMIVLIILVVKA